MFISKYQKGTLLMKEYEDSISKSRSTSAAFILYKILEM